MSDEYPDRDFPWSFYFNGEIMPKWGACWGMARVANYLQVERDADKELGHRDVYIIACQIDHIGVVESADPGVFIYAVQEVLHILLSQRDSVLASLSDQSTDVYTGLVAAAFQMRELAVEQRCAFWSSGYVEDRVRLMEAMRCSQLPSDSPEFELPPHIQRWRRALQLERAGQVRQLHQLAQSGQLDKDTRKRLREIRAS